MRYYKSFDQFQTDNILNESVKQALKYLRGEGINIEPPRRDENGKLIKGGKPIDKAAKKDFEFIKNLLIEHKMPNLIGLFVKYRFKESVALESLDTDEDVGFYTSIKDFVEYYSENKNQLKTYLSKDLIEYDTFEELTDEIIRIPDDIKINKFLKGLYSGLRNQVTKGEKKITDSRTRTIIIGFMDATSDVQRSMTPLKYYKANNVSGKKFIDDIERHIKGGNKKGALINRIINQYSDSVEVVYDENDIIVLRTFDKEFILEFGAQRWCIVYNPESHFDSYVNPLMGKTQYLIFDFSKLESDRLFKFGITIDQDGSSHNGSSQDATNDYIPHQDILSSLGLPSNILEPTYADWSRYSNLVSGVETYDEYVEAVKGLDVIENSGMLKRLILQKFDTKKFVANLIRKSSTWEDLIGEFSHIREKDMTFYDGIKEHIKYTDEFEKYDDINEGRLEDLKKKYPFITELKGLIFAMTSKFPMDTFLKHTMPINSKAFKSIIINKTETIEGVKRIYDYFNHHIEIDNNNYDLKKEIFNELIKNKTIIKLFNESYSTNERYETVDEYLKDNEYIIYCFLIDKNSISDYFSMEGMTLDHIVDMSISLSTYKSYIINAKVVFLAHDIPNTLLDSIKKITKEQELDLDRDILDKLVRFKKIDEIEKGSEIAGIETDKYNSAIRDIKDFNKFGNQFTGHIIKDMENLTVDQINDFMASMKKLKGKM